MAGSILRRGDIAIIGVDTEDTGNPQRDSLSIVFLAPIKAGTVIYITDRAWNGTAFAAASAGEGTVTITVGADSPAGTVFRLSQAQLTGAGINLSDDGEALYLYQGATADTPTTFLHAVDIADGPEIGAVNTDNFDGNELLNTGLVAGVSAVAIGTDNAKFGTRLWNINKEDAFLQINNRNDWNNNNNSPQPVINLAEPDATAPDAVIYVAGSGAGEAIVQLHLDGTYNSGTVAYAIQHAFQNDANLFHPSDITIDSVNDKIFFVDSDIAGHNRIVQASISQILANPGAPIVTTVLYSNTAADPSGSMRTLIIDPANAKIYFDVGTTFNRINYDTAGQTKTQLTDLATLYGATESFITQATINFATNTVYLASSTVDSVFGSDFVSSNRVFVATGLTPTAPTLAFTPITFTQNDTTVTGEGGSLGTTHWPVERGTIRGIDVDESTGNVYIVTGTVILDNDANGLTTYRGGVWMYNPTTQIVTNLYTQNGVSGPVGLLYYIDVDPITGRYYLLDETGTNASVEDSGVWTGLLGTAGTPTFVANVGNINGLGGQGLEIQHAPTLIGSAVAAAVTEASSAPNSGETSRVALFSGLAAADADTPNTGDELRGAQVRISENFLLGATHQDILTINNLQSGTIAGSGITFSYSNSTGTMTLSGVATVAEYKAALELVRFSTSGDNVTDFGTAGTRTVAASVFDGLLYSDEITATVTVTGINDAPVNSVGAAMNFAEDTTGSAGSVAAPLSLPVNAITGVSVFDVDADPATQDINVRLSVGTGTITIRTDVIGGIAPGDVISGNGTGEIVITATQNQINTTLAAMSAAVTGPPAQAAAPNGLVYTPPANFNGATNLTVITNDLGNNGNDPGNSGTGTTEADTDIKTLNIADVNDAPTVTDTTQDSPTILEDTPFTSANAPTVAALFGASFADPLDVQVSASNPSGSTGDSFAGIAITSNGSNPNGSWQYWDGDSWENIAGASTDAAPTFSASTLLRFNPAANFNSNEGGVPTLTARLIESGGPAIVNNATVDLNPAPPTTGPGSTYSTGTVTLSQAITPVNDAPTLNNLAGNVATWTEGAALASLLDVASNASAGDIDSANFDTGTLTVAITTGLVAAQDQLVIRVTGTVSFTATSAFVNGTQIATYTGGGAGGAPFVFTFDADATPAAVQELIRAIAYTNSGGDNPSAGNRTINWTLVDGDGNANNGADTLTVTSGVSVVKVNDAPSGADKLDVAIDEDTAYVFAVSDFGFSDIDGNAFAGIEIVTQPGAGAIRLNGAPIAPGVLFVSAQDITDGKLTYLPALDASGDNYSSFTFKVVDDGAADGANVNKDASANTFSFDVAAINDPVSVASPPTVTLNEDAVDFAVTGLSISDDDGPLAPAGVYEATLSATQGTLNLITTTGLTFSIGDGEGDTVMTFSGTLADINTALATARYTPTPNYNGAAQISLQATDTFGGVVATGSGVATADGNTIAVTVLSVNDAPSGADKTIATSEDDAYTFTLADFGFSDPIDGDSILGVVITTLPTNGALTFHGAPISAGFDAAFDAIAAGALKFVPDADEFATPYATFTFQVRDNGGTANGGADTDQSPNTITVNVTPDNMRPTIDLDADGAGTGFASAYTEGGAAAAIGDTDVDITDPNSGDDIVGATITVTNAVVGDLLSVVGALPGSIAVDLLNSNATTIKLAGAGTQAEYEAAIEQVTFSSTSDDPTAKGANTTRTITVTVNDGDTESLAATSTVTVTDVNDAPAGTNATISATEDEFRLLAESDLGFVDVDGSFASVVISGVTGGKIYYDADGVVGAGAAQEVTLPQTFTAQDLSAGRVSFKAGANSSGAGIGTITFAVTDDDGATDGSPNVLTVDVNAVNDAPVLTTSAGVTAFIEGVNVASTPVAVDASITLVDVDTPVLNSAVVQMTVGAPGDQLNFVNTDATLFGTIQLVGSPSGAITLSAAGGATLAQWQNALRAVTYTSTDEEPIAGDRVVSFVTNDGTGFSNYADKTLTVQPANDAPSGTSATIAIDEDAPRVLTVADLGFTDLDGDSLLSVTIDSVAGGVILYDADGTGANPAVQATFPATYTVADLNDGKIVFQPTADLNGAGAGSIAFRVRDNGGTSPGQDTDGSADTLTINIASVNDAPSGADVTKELVENTSYVFDDLDFGFTDLESHALLAVKITSLPAQGTILLNSVAVSAGQFVSVADINSGLLTYAPVSDTSGDAYASFTFQVRDDGGIDDGGVDLDQSANLFTFDVLPANLPPVIDPVADAPLAENARDTVNGILVTTLTASDPNGDAVTFLFENGTAIQGDFRIVGSEVRYFGTGEDFETGPGTIQLSVIASDGIAQSEPADFDVTITNVVERLFSDSPERVDFNMIAPGSFDDGQQYDARGGTDTILLPTLATVAGGLPWDFGRTFEAGSGADKIKGADGNDIVEGGSGDDWLFGGVGNDRLSGGSGSDVIIGGAGADRLTGGSGSDIHLFRTAADIGVKAGPHDIVTDFNQGADKIDLSLIYKDQPGYRLRTDNNKMETASADRAFDLSWYIEGNSTFVVGDTTGDGKADFALELNGKLKLKASDFIITTNQWGAAGQRQADYGFLHSEDFLL